MVEDTNFDITCKVGFPHFCEEVSAGNLWVHRASGETRYIFSGVPFENNLLDRSLVQKLSIYNWHPGPRREKEGAFEKQIADKWHVITLQDGECAVFFYPNIEVKSLQLHDTRRELPDKVMEGDPVWVLQGVLSRASICRPPLSGQKTFTVLSLQIGTIYAKRTWYRKKSLSSPSEP